MIRVSVVVALVVLGSAFACVGEDLYVAPQPDAGDRVDPSSDAAAGDAAADGSTSVLALLTREVEIVRGTQAKAPIELRWNGPAREVTLSVVTQPGVTVGEAFVPANQIKGELVVDVAVDATFGDKQLSVLAKSNTGEVLAQAQLPLFVRGNPGELDTSFGEQGNAEAPAGEASVGSIVGFGDGELAVLGGVAGKLQFLTYTRDGMLASSSDPLVLPTGYSFSPYFSSSPIRITMSELTTAVVLQSAEANFPVLARVTRSTMGSFQIAPTPLVVSPLTIAHSSEITAQENGILIVEEGARIRRLSSLGAVDPGFQPVEDIPSSYSVSREANVVSSSMNRVLVEFSGKNSASSQWLSYVLADAQTGAVVSKSGNLLPWSGHQPSNTFARATMFNDGTAAVFLGDSRYLRLAPSDPQGKFVQGGVGITELDSRAGNDFALWREAGWEGSERSFASLASLDAEGKLVVRLDVLNAELNPSSASVRINDLPKPDEHIFFQQIANGGRGRIVMFFIAEWQHVDRSNPKYKNVFWIVRRYWL